MTEGASPSSRLLGRVELHALGLGLMIYSPAAVARLEEGRDYMPAGGPLRPPLAELVDAHLVTLLGTGSPQLNYVVQVYLGAPPRSHQSDSCVDFGLRLAGGALCVRDGYDPMEWSFDGASFRMVHVADGDYAITAIGSRAESPADMMVALYLQPTVAPLTGDGWPYLEFQM